MPIIPTYLMSLEQRMQLIQEQEYAYMTSELWAPAVYRARPSQSRVELIQWFLSTATMTDEDEGGNVAFDDMAAINTSITNRTAGRGLELKLEQLEDIDGGGAQMAAQWVREESQLAAYWPQLKTADLMNTGASLSTATATYDGLALFHTAHYVNPVEKGSLSVPSGYATTYRNLHTSANALPIDDSVSLEVALQNLGKFRSYVSTIPTSNGLYPRHLAPVAWFVPPALGPRVKVLTGADFIAAAAGSSGTSGGTLDIKGLLSWLGMGMPYVCPELSAAFGGSDTSYYVLCAPRGARSVLGPIVYIPREPFGIIYHGPMTSAQLAVKRKFQWIQTGRYGIGPGHPFELHKVLAA